MQLFLLVAIFSVAFISLLFADFIRSEGHRIDVIPAVAPTGGVTEGECYLYEDTYGIAYEDALVGIAYSLIYRCPHIKVPKLAGTGLTLAVGDPAYLNTTTLDIQINPTGGVLIGIVKVAATATATVVWIDMDTNKVDG